MSDRTFIADMEPNVLVSGVFTLQNCQLGLTRNGKHFIKCLLMDRTGRLPARMWNASEEQFASLPTNGFVFIEGQTQPYQGELQVILTHIQSVVPKGSDLVNLLPATENDIGEMFDEVASTLRTMKSPSLRALAEAYLGDDALMRRFKQAPAAVQLHHAYLGGLLEHTLNLLKLAEATLPLYPKCNRDIIMMGLFLHDLGKCIELSWLTGFEYTEDGQLIGHIARGAIILEKKAETIREAGVDLPDAALRVLTHIILSHHGKLEFGAVKLPSTPEAIFISHLDDLDAKMNMALDACRPDQDPSAQVPGDFTEKIWALDTRLYRPDPLADEPVEEMAPSEPSPSTPTDDAPDASEAPALFNEDK